VEKDLRNSGVSQKQRHKNVWLEKMFRVGQDPQRIVVPVILIIIITPTDAITDVSVA
jgi:hypothetical protein